MTQVLHSDKAELRAALRAQRAQLPPEDVAAHSTAACDCIIALPIFTAAQLICSYLDMRNEIATGEIIRLAWAQGKTVALPRTLRAERRLALHRIDTLADLQPGPFGLREPRGDAPEIDPAAIDLFLVPGVGFDAAGNRLGYGGGYYDGLLDGMSGWRVALAHALQIVPRVPIAAHDVPMDLLCTEHGLIDCRRARAAADCLRLHNMIFYGHHGAFPQEREHGLRLAVDVELRLGLQAPGLTDDLAATVNYPAVYQLIQRIQSARAFSLFEALAEHIAAGILREFPPVAQATVRARKFNPPVGGLMDAFEVEITRARPDWTRPR